MEQQSYLKPDETERLKKLELDFVTRNRISDSKRIPGTLAGLAVGYEICRGQPILHEALSGSMHMEAAGARPGNWRCEGA